MKNYLGILGDPAKVSLYDTDFYRISDQDSLESSFYLLGASESDIGRREYRYMYEKLSKMNGSAKSYAPIKRLTDPSIKSFRSRVGLFPSSVSHLIRGPSFAFASYPVNSTSKKLKLKSNIFRKLLSPFLPFKVLGLAYYPLGGMAATKTYANTNRTEMEIAESFYLLRRKNNLDWYYLEAGSGQNALPYSTISLTLLSQVRALTGRTGDEINKRIETLERGIRIIVPGTIYGGGITSSKHLQDILNPVKDGAKLVPEIVVIGNISEKDVSMTYKLVDEINIINEVPGKTIDILL